MKEEEEEEPTADSVTCLGCLPLLPALQLVVLYYMLSILYCLGEIARSYASKMVTFALIYAVFSIPYLAILYFGAKWLFEDSVETRPNLIWVLFLKIVAKTAVDCLMLAQILMMDKEIISTRLIQRAQRLQVAKLTPAQVTDIKENGRQRWATGLAIGFAVSLVFEIYVYCMGKYYKRIADEEDGEFAPFE